MESLATSEFARVIGAASFSLAEAALALSWSVQELDGVVEFDTIGHLARIDEMAASIPSPTASGIAGHLFGDGSVLRGNVDDYYDPANSFLDRVLATGFGLPITLSVVMIEVGLRLGVPLVGIGLPGHFVVGEFEGGRLERFFDPFARGRLLDREGCRELVSNLAGRAVTIPDALFSPVSNHAVIERMLNNVKTIYSSRSGDLEAVRRLARVLTLRSFLPGIGATESAERFRVVAPLN